MNILLEAAPLLLSGLKNTILIFVGSFVVTAIVGLIVGTMRSMKIALLEPLLLVYVETFRGTSLVVQLFWIYFVLPQFGLDIPALAAAIMGLGLCFGAYASEIVRGAIQAVGQSQYDAAHALSMSKFTAFVRVILPQALSTLLDPVRNLTILLLKSTATASLITISELTFVGYQLNAATNQTIAIFGFVLLVYYLLATFVELGFVALKRLMKSAH